MLKGKVKWFNARKGCGFIQIATGDYVFVDRSEIVGKGHKSLREGEDVQLIAEMTSWGYKALNVVRNQQVKENRRLGLVKR